MLPSALWPVHVEVLGDEPMYIPAAYCSEFRPLQVTQQQFVNAVLALATVARRATRTAGNTPSEKTWVDVRILFVLTDV